MVTRQGVLKSKFNAVLYENARKPSWRVQASIILITIFAIIVTIILGSRTYRASRLMALDQFNQQQLILARSAATGIETYLSEASVALSSATKIPAMQKMTIDCLNTMKHMYEGFIPKTSVRRFDEQGNLSLIYPFDGWRKEIMGRNYSGEKFFQAAKNGENITISEIIINENDERRIRMAVPVYAENGMDNAENFSGVLVISFDLNVVGDTFISPIVSGKTGYAWMTDQNGKFLAHYEKSFIGRDSFKVRAEKDSAVSYSSINQIQQKILEGEEGIGRYVSGWHRGITGRIEKLIAYSPVHVIDKTWSVAVVAPVKEVDRIIRNAGMHALYTFGFVILILITAGTFLSVSAYRWSNLLERKVEERTKELKEASDYLDNLIRCANAPIVVLNPERRVTLFNEAFTRMSGRAEEEIMGQTLNILFPHKYRSSYMQRIERAMKKKKNWEGAEIPIIRKDGRIRVGLWTSSNVYGSDGIIPIATIVHGKDITMRKRAEEKLKSTMKNLTMAQQIAQIGSWEWDIATDEVVWSDEMSRLFKWEPEETKITFTTYIDRVHPEDRDHAKKSIQKALEGGMSSCESEHRIVQSDGEIRIHHVKGEIIRGADRKPVKMVGIVHDITDQKRAERERSQLEAQLFHAQKMKALGTLVAGVAHEINNPVNKINYDINLLRKIWMDMFPVLEKQDNVEPGRKYGGLTYNFIKENMPQLLSDMGMVANRLSRIVGDLKDFSRQSNISERMPIELNRAVENAVRLVETTLKKSEIELKLDFEDISPVIDGSLHNIEQIIINIIINAIEAIDHDHGKIEITTKLDKEDRRTTVSISDNGRGVDPAIADRLFDPFVTDRQGKGGTGLGLSITYNIVEAHSGNISFYNNAEKGTTFILSFPAVINNNTREL